MAEGDSPLAGPHAPHHYGAYGPSAKSRMQLALMGQTPTLGQGSCLRFWARTVLPAAGAPPKTGATEAHPGSAAASNSSSSSKSSSGSAFLLNSRVDNPHGATGAAVAALAVHPGGALAVTCSSAAPEFKLWCKLQWRGRPSGAGA